MSLFWFSSPSVQFSSVQPLNHVWLFTTPWTAALQASLFITNSCSLLKFMTIESVMLSNHLTLCHPLLLLSLVFPSIRGFSNESTLHIRWPKYWSFSFSISPSNEYSGLISFKIDWLDLLEVQGTLKSLLQHHNFCWLYRASLSLPCFILYSRVKFACYSRHLFTFYFCLPVPRNEKDIFFGC